MKILNIGCGGQKYGTHFVDLYPLRDGIIKCNVDNEKLPFPNNYFDEVFSNNLFEHLKNPGFVLKEMYRVLKKGGMLVLITDNAGFIFWHLPWSKVHYDYSSAKAPLDKHYALYTTHHLKNHFKSLKLKQIKIEYIMEKRNYPLLIIRIISRMFRPFFKKLFYPQIKITGIK